VFSYFPPDNRLPGSTLLAPEFAIQSTSTALAHVNIAYDFAYHKMPIDLNLNNRPIGTWIDTTQFEPEACVGDNCDPTPLIDDLNVRLMHGTLSTTGGPNGRGLYGTVLDAVNALPGGNLTARVQEAIYLIASSSEYQVER
jgi:hypothetical protein